MIRFIARQKFRFDLGQSFMAIVNFTFIVIAASDKIATLIHIPAKVILVIAVPSAITLVWCLGLLLDKMRFADSYQSELNSRNAMLSSVHKKLDGH